MKLIKRSATLQQEKDNLRKKIKTLKGQYSQQDLIFRSQEVLAILEITGVFQEAKHIFIYNGLSDEVQTLDFIGQWSKEKTFYLPVVKDSGLILREYNTDVQLTKSSYGIMEPEGNDFSDYEKIDLIIIPGMAFDRQKSRLGKGKGFYDHLLPKIKAPKVGICFDFQLYDKIPSDENDVKMDYIISENELIW